LALEPTHIADFRRFAAAWVTDILNDM